MKKILTMALAVILALSTAACGTETAETPETKETTTTAAATTAAQTTQATTAAPEADSTQPENTEAELSMITGTLYAPFAAIDVREMDFGYEEGTCTPEKIAAALTEWTGLVFDITSTIDGDAVKVDWKSGSSLAEGQPPEPQKEGFEFYDQETMRWFMLNSLCYTILANMDVSDVYYSLEGSDLNDLELGQDFNPAIAYNRIENPSVVVAVG
jgi:hypothetical protein